MKIEEAVIGLTFTSPMVNNEIVISRLKKKVIVNGRYSFELDTDVYSNYQKQYFTTFTSRFYVEKSLYFSNRDDYQTDDFKIVKVKANGIISTE